MPKSPDAFRTISEVADWLGVQAHVLRFWESKFAQVKPVKRAGGRRYYRPADMLLIGGIKKLLHDDGLTIKGAQKLLREKGVAFVADMSQPLDDLTIAVIESDLEELPEATEEHPAPDSALVGSAEQVEQETGPVEEVEPELAEVTLEPEVAPIVAEDAPVAPVAADSETQEIVEEAETFTEETSVEAATPSDIPADEPLLSASPDVEESAESDPVQMETESSDGLENLQAEDGTPTHLEESTTEPVPAPQPVQEATAEALDVVEVDEPKPEASPALEAEPEAEPVVPSFRARARTTHPAPETVVESTTPPEPPASHEAVAEPEAVTEPEQLDALAQENSAVPEGTAASEEDAGAAEAPPEQTLKPRAIDIPPVPPVSEIEVAPAILSSLARVRHVPPAVAREMKPHLARLTRLRASMANSRKENSKD